MNRKLALLLSVILCNTAYGQITIGSNAVPEKGAILQLKDDTSDDYNPSINASKGLILPRVKLSNLNPTTDNELAESIGNIVDSYNMNDHIGLVVYNINELRFDKTLCKWQGQQLGIYIWNGTEWLFLGEKKPRGKDVRTITDDGKRVTISYKDEVTSYRYSNFGNAGTWMTENLATKYLPNGDLATRSSNTSITDPYYYTPNGLADDDLLINNTQKLGFLYNWAATMAGDNCTTVNQKQIEGDVPGPNEVEVLNGGSIQGICPIGWHLPSDREWNQLEKEMTENADLYSTATYTEAEKTWNPKWETKISWRGNIQGGVMKSSSKVTDSANDTGGKSKTAREGGFDLPLVGWAYNGSTSGYGEFINLWTSSNYSSDTNRTWFRDLFYDREYEKENWLMVYRHTLSKSYMFSVRCKKNNEE